jgi:uncharacterized protein YutE (UPF0331/DUF86 family)
VSGADLDLVGKRAARIETCVQELRSLGRAELIRTDLREERFVEHTLQIAIQAILNIASHIVSEERLGEPARNQDLIDLLARHGWVDEAQAAVLHRMIGFRNVLVHGYEAVDLSIVEDIARRHLDDLLSFARSIRSQAARRERQEKKDRET